MIQCNIANSHNFVHLQAVVPESEVEPETPVPDLTMAEMDTEEGEEEKTESVKTSPPRLKDVKEDETSDVKEEDTSESGEEETSEDNKEDAAMDLKDKIHDKETEKESKQEMPEAEMPKENTEADNQAAVGTDTKRLKTVM